MYITCPNGDGDGLIVDDFVDCGDLLQTPITITKRSLVLSLIEQIGNYQEVMSDFLFYFSLVGYKYLSNLKQTLLEYRPYLNAFVI